MLVRCACLAYACAAEARMASAHNFLWKRPLVYWNRFHLTFALLNAKGFSKKRSPGGGGDTMAAAAAATATTP